MLIMICDKCDEVVNYIKSESYQKFYCDGKKYCTCQESKIESLALKNQILFK